MPVDVFPIAQFITAICSMDCCSLGGGGCFIEQGVSEGGELDLPTRVATHHAKGHFTFGYHSSRIVVH